MSRAGVFGPFMLVLALPAFLAGCAGTMSGLDGQGKFSCKAPDGIACASLAGVYANALQNNLPGQERPAGQPRRQRSRALAIRPRRSRVPCPARASRSAAPRQCDGYGWRPGRTTRKCCTTSRTSTSSSIPAAGSLHTRDATPVRRIGPSCRQRPSHPRPRIPTSVRFSGWSARLQGLQVRRRFPCAGASYCSRQALRRVTNEPVGYPARGLPAGAIGARRSSATAAVARDFSHAATHRHPALCRLAGGDATLRAGPGGLRRTRIAGHRFLHRGLAANRRQRRNGEGAGQSLRLLPAGDRHPGHPLREPEHPPGPAGAGESAAALGRGCPSADGGIRAAGKIAVTPTSSACSHGGASITTCRAPASQFFASDLSAARFSGGDLDHPAARPRGAGRCRRGAACPGKRPRHAQVGAPAGP
jgi:hypothetical protein